MSDKEKFFKEISRVLKPKGNLVIYAWLAKNNPNWWEKRYLLEPICREGRLPSLGSAEDYIEYMKNTGFKDIHFADITSQVKKTWSLCIGRVIKKVFTDRRYLQYLFSSQAQEKPFIKSMFRILAAYETGAMRYGFFSATA
jgi:tocopherol O-methyltransferase